MQILIKKKKKTTIFNYMLMRYKYEFLILEILFDSFKYVNFKLVKTKRKQCLQTKNIIFITFIFLSAF